MSNDEAADVKVERSVLGRVFGGKRVKHKLEVVLTPLGLLVEVDFESEELRRTNRDFVLSKRY